MLRELMCDGGYKCSLPAPANGCRPGRKEERRYQDSTRFAAFRERSQDGRFSGTRGASDPLDLLRLFSFPIPIHNPGVQVVLDGNSSLWLAFWGIAALGGVVDGAWCYFVFEFCA